MRVILRDDIENLGDAGDVVEVKDGFARNYLIPKGLAVEASEGAVRALQDQQRAEERRRERQTREALELAKTLEETEVRIGATAGEKGRLFGSITAKDIAEAVKEQTGVEIDRRRVELEEPIKELGEHEVRIRLGPDVSVSLTVCVLGEGE